MASKGHVYGFNIKSASGSSAPATGGSAAKPAIIVDKFQQTAINAPKKETERGVQKGTGDKPNFSGI
ncbi:uncharacterized protein ACA1_170260 [Acanthamoeba castellanii str. Neff]|uniref:Uncharacterized protein n=1 Tax=Acanthamoeba castellanii (strain ATCC 30010 / Neff) TaxID=1257118 RepID=L8HHV6_ACACF|nr:uncharacterized protein ACA1_170260 [Acanthamoeba castellanii str. Neff]ELR24288.1 hypothetical protein ACA1_170260 [Acanthamoeba castellanii str. Neff]